MTSQQGLELIYSQTCLPNDRPQCSGGNLRMVGNCEPSMRRCNVPQGDMTAALSIDLVSNLSQCLHYVASRHSRQATHGLTSTTSSEMEGGIASPCASRLST